MPIATNASRLARSSIALVVAGLTVAGLAACDKHSPAQPGANPRQVTVIGSGHVQGVPDTLTADVGIEFTAPDVTSAMNQTGDRQQAVINALAGAGLDRKNISTTEVTLQPQYSNPEPGGSKPTAATPAAATRRMTARRLKLLTLSSASPSRRWTLDTLVSPLLVIG